MQIGQLFSQDKVNTERQYELDIAKFFAVIFMIWCHVNRELGGYNGSFGDIVVDTVLGGPLAAPIFMICMGISINYSHKNNVIDLAKRGLSILLTGYLLNVFRYVIPDMIKFLLCNDISFLNTTLYKLFSVDILQFAGMCFLMIAFLKKMNIPKLCSIIITIGLSVSGTLLSGLSLNNTIPNLLAGLLWRSNDYSFFPFFSWFIFPLAGYWGGKYLQHCTDKTCLYKKISPFCFCFFMTILIIASMTPISNIYMGTSQYYSIHIVVAFFIILLAVAIFGFDYFLCRKIALPKQNIIQKLSKNTNSIYCIHWVIIGFLDIIKTLTYRNYTLPFGYSFLLAMLIVFVSYKLADFYSSCKSKIH